MRSISLLLALAALLLTATGATAQETTVEVGDFYFCDDSLSSGECTTTVTAGETLAWDYSEGTAGHTVTECGESCDAPTDTPFFDSGRMLAGDTFSVTFDEPGTYLYYCEFHPQAMRATVVVEAQATPTAPPTATATPAATASPQPTPSPDEPTPAASPTEGATPSPTPESADDDDGGVSPVVWLIAGVVVAAVAASAAGALVLRRRS